MKSPRRLQDELRFVSEFTTLFDVMQQVAISQLQRTREQAAARPAIAEALTRDYLPLLPPTCRDHPLIRGGRAGRLLVVMTSDEGLVGPLYTTVLRAALVKANETAGAISRRSPDQRGIEWLLVGQRGLRLLGAQAASAKVLPVPSEESADEQMQRVGQYVVTRCRQEDLRDAWLIAPRFVSTARQDVTTTQLFPLPVGEQLGRVAPDELVIEPTVDGVLEQLAIVWSEAVCVEAFWSARCAEFAARALHVEASRQELGKRTRVLRHDLFKTMHERTDVLVRETCVVQRQVAKRLAHVARCG